MTVDPFELVQNEQLLKAMSNVDDALIGIQEVQSDTNQVDLMIICKDEFSWTGEVWSNFLNAVDLGLETKTCLNWGIVYTIRLVFGEVKIKNGET